MYRVFLKLIAYAVLPVMFIAGSGCQDQDKSAQAIDFDEDGQSELWRAIDDGSSDQLDVLTLAHRDGGAMIEFYNSGELLQDFSGDIRDLLAVKGFVRIVPLGTIPDRHKKIEDRRSWD